MMGSFERALLEEERRRNPAVDPAKSSVWDLVMFTGEEAARINEGRRIGGYEKVEDLYHDAVIDFCDNLIAEDSKKITQLPLKANHMAAAGPGIMAEPVDWNPDSEIINVRICEDSMSPLFDDQQIITMRSKKHSRSPYMKKGTIYLVQLEGEWMVKRYDTRKPRANEKEAEYLTGTKMVGILKSENPTYADIDITGPFEWAA
ncbi:MAG: S24 family peptidase [Akkermansiaceae bacterium]